MDYEDRQTQVSDLVRKLLKENRRTSGLSRHQVLVAINREMGLHVDHQQMVDSALAALGTKTRKQRYVPKRLR